MLQNSLLKQQGIYLNLIMKTIAIGTQKTPRVSAMGIPDDANPLNRCLPAEVVTRQWMALENHGGCGRIEYYGWLWMLDATTTRNFNIAPQKWWLEDYFPIGKVAFQGLC